jgi:glycosyltransferase involved in cell wall biosynthesis
MKILELTHYSAGICGVWQRVKQESELLIKKGHVVKVFSSNIVKGANEIAPKVDEWGGLEIRRFPAKKLGGESFMKWDFEKEFIKFKPDVVIAHGFRQLHTTKALKLAKKIGAKVFLVTHAPFVDKNTSRSLVAEIVVSFYDKFIAPRTINKFDKVIYITKWEMPYLLNLGLEKEKIVYVPNGIPEEFFKQKKQTEKKRILFLGRISKIKDIGTLIKSIGIIKDKKISLDIIGPVEEKYGDSLKKLITNLNLEKRINFLPAIFDTKKKISVIDEHSIFILPSIREAMPQGLIEAMAREKIVIASKNNGTLDLIKDRENGFLFDVGNERELAKKIDYALDNWGKMSKIKSNAKNSVRQFYWDKIIKKLEAIINNKKSPKYL